MTKVSFHAEFIINKYSLLQEYKTGLTIEN